MDQQAGRKRAASVDIPSPTERTEKKARQDQRTVAVQTNHPATGGLPHSTQQPPAQTTRDARAQGQVVPSKQGSNEGETASEIAARFDRAGVGADVKARLTRTPKNQTFRIGDQFEFSVEHVSGAQCVDMTFFDFEYADGKRTTVDQQRLQCRTKSLGMNLGREVTEVSFTLADVEIGTWKWLHVTCRPWADGPSGVSECHTNARYMIKSGE